MEVEDEIYLMLWCREGQEESFWDFGLENFQAGFQNVGGWELEIVSEGKGVKIER